MTASPSLIHYLLHEHLKRHPARWRAFTDDPTYRLQMTWLEEVLLLVDEALDRRGIDMTVRGEAIHDVIIGIAASEAAAARVEMLVRCRTEPSGPDWISTGHTSNPDNPGDTHARP